MTFRVLLAALVPAFACSSDSGSATGPSTPDQPPSPPPSVAAISTTLDFGRSPVQGEVRIDPTAPDLRYAIDLDEDGRPEESGPVGLGLRVGYEFAEPGPHRIEVLLESGEERFDWSRVVTVDDPSAVSAPLTGRVEGLQHRAGFGIAADSVRNALYLSFPFDTTLVRLTADGLREVWRLETPFIPGAIALAPDGGTLYVDAGDSLVAVDVSGAPEVIGVVAPTSQADTEDPLLPGPAGSLLSLGDNGLLWIDPVSGATRALIGGPVIVRVAAVGPEGNRVVALSGGIRMFEGPDLAETWNVPLPVGNPFSARAIAFSPAGDRVYVLVFEPRDTWRFLVLDAADGRTLEQLVISPPAFGGPEPVVPAARTGNGRFVVMTSSFGAFVIDGLEHRPIALVGEEEGGCCRVAAIDGGTGLVFAEDTRLTRVRIDR